MGLDRGRIHGGADMAQVRSWAGLDVHAAKVVAATVDRESGELAVRRLSGETAEVVGFCAGLAGPVRVAYEAGPTGFELSRRNPVLRYPTRAYQPDRASRTQAGPAAPSTDPDARPRRGHPVLRA
jgi:hypothetical protein